MKKLIFLFLALSLAVSGCKPKEPVYRAALVEIMATGCPGCEAIKPLIAEITKEYAGVVKVEILDINTADGNRKAGLYTFKGTPTLIFLDSDGVQYFKLETEIHRDIIEAILNSKINPAKTKK